MPAFSGGCRPDQLAPLSPAGIVVPPHDYLKPTVGTRAWALTRFVASAAGVSLALHFALQEPWLGIGLAFALLGFGLPQLRARQRLRELLSSGDLRSILELWNEAIETLPHHRTVGPLIRATALAAHGLVQLAHRLGTGAPEDAQERRLAIRGDGCITRHRSSGGRDADRICGRGPARVNRSAALAGLPPAADIGG